MSPFTGSASEQLLRSMSNETCQRLWLIGVDALELINTYHGVPQLDDFLVRRVHTRRGLLRPILAEDLKSWVSDQPPCFEPTASSYMEAIFRRFERLLISTLYAGTRFKVVPGVDLDAIPADLDYELATAFIKHRIDRIDSALAASGLRREVIANSARPTCPLSWERPCVGEWRFQMWTDVLGAAPCEHWTLNHRRLLEAIRAPLDPGRELPRIVTDPDTRSVFLDGREVATRLTPDVFAYVAAVAAAHPHAIPFSVISMNLALHGKNQTRLRESLCEQSPAVKKLILASNQGHFLQLPQLS